MNQKERKLLVQKNKTKSNDELIRTDVNTKDNRLSKETWDKIDEFKRNVKDKIENK